MKKVVSMSRSRDHWQAAFPMQEAQRAAAFLQIIWQQLLTDKPELLNSKFREDKITEKLSAYLMKLSIGQGRLTGFWQNEDRLPFIDTVDSGEVPAVKSIRKDITYKSNHTGKRLDLIFEFKKMSTDKSSLRHYRGKQGMGRFVTGHYAHGLPIAVMVAMLVDDPVTCISSLKKSLLSQASRDELRMVPLAKNKYLLEPSKVLPASANFDTEHNRPIELGPSHGTIILSHMFLKLPGSD